MFSSLDFSQIKTIGIIAVAVIVVLVLIAQRLGLKLPATALSWQNYLRGQGVILLVSLLLGMGVGWASVRYLGVKTSQTADQVKLVEYRQLSVADQPVYEDLDVDGYTHLVVYAKSSAPQSSEVSVRVIPEQSEPQMENLTQFEGKESGWSRLDEPIAAKHLTLVIGGAGVTGTRATQAEVLVFLSKK